MEVSRICCKIMFFMHDKYQTPCSPYLIIYGDNRVIV